MQLFNGQVQTVGPYWYMFIHKPIYGTCVAIRGAILDKAIQLNKRIVVQCPHGEAIIDPKSWKKTAKRIEKEFKIPGVPMVLYQAELPYKEELKPIEAFSV